MYQAEIISDKYYQIIQTNADKLDSAIRHYRDFNTDTEYSYATIKMCESDYLLKLNGEVIENLQYMIMRTAVGIVTYGFIFLSPPVFFPRRNDYTFNPYTT